MKFHSTISYSMVCRHIGLMFVLFNCLPVSLQAETVYITDNLFIGLHKEKSIDSAILKILPSGTALEIIKRDGNFVNIRDTEGVTGWIADNYLVSLDPKTGNNLDANSAQLKIRELETELQRFKKQQASGGQDIPPDSAAKKIKDLELENEKLKQQATSDKLKSGEMQANLAELRNQISQNSSNNNLTLKIKQLTEEKAELEDTLEQLQKGSHSNGSDLDSQTLLSPIIFPGMMLLLGLIIGIFLMVWREKRRYGGLRL